MTSPSINLCHQTATTLRNQIRSRTVSAREVVQAHLDHIERINEQINAICTLVPADETLAQADTI
ncbi:MAG: amidase, partial [Pseudomonadales bacterium]|nr:amidase [Pseudomonadales bacterium]